MPKAIIDLGTNTFHLLIVDNQTTLYKTSLAAKLGMGGINQNIITAEAIERAMDVLKGFKQKITELKVTNTYAFGTSALRNATNSHDLIAKVKNELEIDIKVIDGQEEAELIYLGVKKAVEITESSLIIDIGGGSVEFIICNANKILWLQSFEMGGQRLMERFMKKDPIGMAEIERMNTYFRDTLLPLANAIHQYHPKTMIGSSGSFDTLNDIFFTKKNGVMAPENIAGFDYPMTEFGWAYEQLVFSNREQRMKIGGMIELRVDMIVVAVCLIKYLLDTFEITNIKISNFALKEGVLAKLSN
jgi:exopolyphosphatase / guanosine-5'-triphosphate,3'-diphosphate pyrophosphatase